MDRDIKTIQFPFDYVVMSSGDFLKKNKKTINSNNPTQKKRLTQQKWADSSLDREVPVERKVPQQYIVYDCNLKFEHYAF